MSSRSSSRDRGGPLPIGTVQGHRGNRGELTVKVVSGEGVRWEHLTRVLIQREPEGKPASYAVEHSRAYRDRLVLKLESVDDPDVAEGLRGCGILAPPDQVPELPEGRYYLSRLIGMEARDGSGDRLGVVEDVLEAGGNEVLAIRQDDHAELLVPLVRAFVNEVDTEAGRIILRNTEDLRELARRDEEGRG